MVFRAWDLPIPQVPCIQEGIYLLHIEEIFWIRNSVQSLSSVVNFNFVFSLQITIYGLMCAGIAGTENDGIVPKVLCLLLLKCKLQLQHYYFKGSISEDAKRNENFR